MKFGTKRNKRGPAPATSIEISPAPGRRVRHPSGALLEAGETVERTPFWQRRLDDGDVVTGAGAADQPKEA